MVFLLDTNLLLSLAWEGHQHHALAHQWLVTIGDSPWATCPFTQAGFVRISSNPKFLANAVSVREAFAQLDRMTGLPSHVFWRDSIPLTGSSLRVRDAIRGHNQITDAYLVSLAIQNGGKLATMDRGILALLREKSQQSSVVIVSDAIPSSPA